MTAEKLLSDSKGFPGYCQVVSIYLFILFFAPILTVMNSGNSQWGKLTGKRIWFCAWWGLNRAYDVGFSKSLLVLNMLVCSFCWEQRVKLQLCQAGEKEGEAELQEMVSSCPNVDGCSLLWTFVPVVLLDPAFPVGAIAAGQEACSWEPGGDFWGKSCKGNGNKYTLETD